MEINVDCENREAGRNLRCVCISANLFGGRNEGFLGRGEEEGKEAQEDEAINSNKEEANLFEHIPGLANFKSKGMRRTK